MTYGYDLALLFPVQSLYDTGMINMYVNAMQKDYERGLADQKEFISKYGDFTSPFMKDIESWDNATVGAYRKLINSMEQNGIDPVRSQEGRALISKFINSVPYGDLAKLKQSAQMGQSYNQLLAKGILDGTLDYDTAAKLDGDFKNWDTLKYGGWEKIAPTSQKTENEILAPYIKDLYDRAYEYDAEKSKAKPGYRVTSVSDKAITDELGRAYKDIMKDPMMQLRIKESGLTPEEYFNLNLFSHVRRELPDKEKVDEYYMKKYESNLSEGREIRKENRQNAAKERLLGTAHQYKMQEIEAKGKSNGNKSGTRDGSSLHYNVYNQANLANGETDVTIEQMHTVAKSVTENVMNMKFRKYKDKNGNIPESVKNSKAYKKAYATEYAKSLNNQKIKAYKARVEREKKVVENSHVKNSTALGIGLGEDELSHLSGVLHYDYDTHTMEGYANRIYTLQEMNNVRTGKTVENGLMVSKHASKNTPGKVKVEVKFGNTKNLIPQTEPNGKIGWYVALADGTFYKLGSFDPTRIDLEYAGNDLRYLTDMKINSKSVNNVLPDSEKDTEDTTYDDILDITNMD